MNRPTIALCCILKDEVKNLPQLLASVEGCFDEIYLTDTGSTDGSQEWITRNAQHVSKCQKLVLKNFEWCDDFAKARNHSMKDVTADYVMWMDLDDVMSDKEKFKQWRDHVMMLADFWLAPYWYAFDENKKPTCTFLRERVIKTSKKFEWEYFIHEGMIAKEHVNAQVVNSWQVHHMRTPEDYQKDYDRNVSMLEKRSKVEELPVRLKFYHGKELFDKGRFQESYVWLNQVVDHKDMQHHDRILTYEYLVRASIHRYHQEQIHLPKPDKTIIAKALSLGMQALAIAPERAELFCLVGDCFTILDKPLEALPFFEGAKSLNPGTPNGNTFLFTNAAAYTFIPSNQIAKIKMAKGDINGALFEAKTAYEKWQHHESETILKEIIRIKDASDRPGPKIKTNEIVISCVPGSHPYEFDERTYKEKGIGGSETALVEVALHLKKLTNLPVVVFNTREKNEEFSGVEYRRSQEMLEYFGSHEPKHHIAWRHNIKLTDAPTFLWCHDLVTPGAEVTHYDKIVCLSEFHKNYVQVQQQIPDDKIVISRNGVDESRFEHKSERDPLKVVWPSSPDRGLDRVIDIVEMARLKSGLDFSLHVYYGFDNMKKYGGAFGEMAKHLEEKIKKPWITYHGNIEQKKLAKEFLSASYWLYPANFIETYCITVLEAVYSGMWSIVREIGALKNTVKPFSDKGMADLVFLDADTVEQKEKWADLLIEAHDKKKYELVNASQFDYSWEGVAKDFIRFMNIEAQPTNIKEKEIDMAVFTPNGTLEKGYGLMDIGV